MKENSIRRAVREGRAASVSAYVAAALEEKTKLDDLRSLLDAMLEETGGPLRAAERRAADEALGVRPRSPSRTASPRSARSFRTNRRWQA